MDSQLRRATHKISQTLRPHKRENYLLKMAVCMQDSVNLFAYIAPFLSVLISRQGCQASIMFFNDTTYVLKKRLKRLTNNTNVIIQLLQD